MKNNIWTSNFKKLKAYKKKYGSGADYSKEGKQFLQWTENIRKHPEKLSERQYKDLVNIGFKIHRDSQWDQAYSELVAYHRKFKTSFVSPFQTEYEKLFDWTVNQRHAGRFLNREQTKKLNDINFEWEVQSDESLRWNSMYLQLVDFKNQYGHTKVPEGFKQNPKLGTWVTKQRRNKSQGSLDQTRVKKLGRIGFLWKEDIAKLREDAWQKNYTELISFKKANGHIDRLVVKHKNYSLGLWIETQIVHQHKLSPERKQKLNTIDFIWSKGNLYEERWNAMFEKLKAYKAKQGHCRVTRREDFKLSVWIQRNKRDRQKIGINKKNKLEKIGVKWPHEFQEEMWEIRYNELKAFKKKQGHLSVAKSDAKLHEWIETQKKYKVANTLSEEREIKLNKLGFIWKGEAGKKKMDEWSKMFKKFAAFKEKFPSRVNIKLKDNPELNNWVFRQIHDKEKLSAVKRKKLDSIDFSWAKNLKNELWDEMYIQLVAYKKKYRNCDVPQNFLENQKLAKWVNGQRNKNISSYRKEKLNNIGFLWANELKEKRWNERLAQFTELRKKNLTVSLTQHPVLYAWLYQQRKNFNTLPVEKQKKLVKAGLKIEK